MSRRVLIITIIALVSLPLFARDRIVAPRPDVRAAATVVNGLPAYEWTKWGRSEVSIEPIGAGVYRLTPLRVGCNGALHWQCNIQSGPSPAWQATELIAPVTTAPVRTLRWSVGFQNPNGSAREMTLIVRRAEAAVQNTTGAVLASRVLQIPAGGETIGTVDFTIPAGSIGANLMIVFGSDVQPTTDLGPVNVFGLKIE